MKNHIISGIVALGVSLGVIWVYPEIVPGSNTIKIEHINSTPAQNAVFTINEDNEIVPLDFTGVAEKVMDAVVHIQSTRTSKYGMREQREYREFPDPFRDFFRR